MEDRLLEEEQERPAATRCGDLDSNGVTRVTVGLVSVPREHGRVSIGLHVSMLHDNGMGSWHDIFFTDPEADLRAALVNISETAATCLRRLDGHD
jgi:hypothetical protein